MWILHRKESLDSREIIYLETHKVIMFSIYGFSSICSNLKMSHEFNHNDTFLKPNYSLFHIRISSLTILRK
jgi:hypothetical protein